MVRAEFLLAERIFHTTVAAAAAAMVERVVVMVVEAVQVSWWRSKVECPEGIRQVSDRIAADKISSVFEGERIKQSVGWCNKEAGMSFAEA